MKGCGPMRRVLFRRPITGSVNYSGDPHFVPFYPIHNTIGSVYHFAAIRIVDFGDYSSRTEELL